MSTKNKIAVRCISSSLHEFDVGETYLMNRYSDRFGVWKMRVWDAKNYNKDNNRIVEIRGLRETFAVFEKVKKKSILKMLVRAHVNYAKSCGWGDSKGGSYKSWSGTPYNSVNNWARCFAIGYDIDAIEIEAAEDGDTINQEYLNWFVEEQMSYF